jgi:hypothetical protein
VSLDQVCGHLEQDRHHDEARSLRSTFQLVMSRLTDL